MATFPIVRWTIDGEKYEFDMNRVMRSEMSSVKKVTGLRTVNEWLGALGEDDDAQAALVWIAKRRNGDEVGFTDFDFNMIEFMESMEVEGDDAAVDPTESTTETEPT